MACAYARPSSASARPELNKPALKKYGLRRPDLSLNSPKRSTPSSRHRSIKERIGSQLNEGLGRDGSRFGGRTYNCRMSTVTANTTAASAPAAKPTLREILANPK